MKYFEDTLFRYRMKLNFAEEAAEQLLELERDKSKMRIFRAVAKTIDLMQEDLRHPSLNVHEHISLSREKGFKVFESYTQNRTPGAYRVFWRYGPEKNETTIVAIVPHP
jgi:hypothetical protein